MLLSHLHGHAPALGGGGLLTACCLATGACNNNDNNNNNNNNNSNSDNENGPDQWFSTVRSSVLTTRVRCPVRSITRELELRTAIYIHTYIRTCTYAHLPSSVIYYAEIAVKQNRQGSVTNATHGFILIFHPQTSLGGHAVVKALCYNTEGRGIESR
jgi:hypothetical protein